MDQGVQMINQVDQGFLMTTYIDQGVLIDVHQGMQEEKEPNYNVDCYI